MGCCGSSRRSDIHRAPVYYYCPLPLEQRDPAPHVPMPCGIDLLHTLPSNLMNNGVKDGQVQPTDASLVKDSLDEPVNLNKPDEEDVCPTCLEEYDSENPRIVTKCEHHFHLSCILEWQERSDSCPICDKIMMFDLE